MQVLIGRLLAFVDPLHTSTAIDRTPYAEWVIIQTRVATLHALSRCLTYADSEGEQRVPATLRRKEHSEVDGPCSLADAVQRAAREAGKADALLAWLHRLCIDAAVLRSEPVALHQALRSPLLMSTSSLTVSHVLAPMSAALPDALQAACVLLSSSARNGDEGMRGADGAQSAAMYPTLFWLAIQQLEQALSEPPGGPNSSANGRAAPASPFSAAPGANASANQRDPVVLRALAAAQALACAELTAQQPRCGLFLLTLSQTLLEHAPELWEWTGVEGAACGKLVRMCAAASLLEAMCAAVRPMDEVTQSGTDKGRCSDAGHADVLCSTLSTGLVGLCAGASRLVETQLPSEMQNSNSRSLQTEAVASSAVHAAVHLIQSSCAVPAVQADALCSAAGVLAAALPSSVAGGRVVRAAASLRQCVGSLCGHGSGGAAGSEVQGQVVTIGAPSQQADADVTMPADVQAAAAQCASMLSQRLAPGHRLPAHACAAATSLLLQLCEAASGSGAELGARCVHDCVQVLAGASDSFVPSRLDNFARAQQACAAWSALFRPCWRTLLIPPRSWCRLIRGSQAVRIGQ